MHVNVNDLPGEEIAPGVVERVLMKEEEGDDPEKISAYHYVLRDGGTITFEKPMTEFQHYIVSGTAYAGSRLVNQDTTIFIQAGGHDPVNQSKGLRRHSFTQAGEGETRIFSVAYEVPRPAFRWAKSRSMNLLEKPTSHQTGIGYTQLITEEEHAIMGALRMHAVDIQTHPPGQHKGGVSEGGKLVGHRNPEEIMFFLRGTGKAMAEGELYDVRPGSYLYTREGTLHGIWNTTDDILQYICMEMIEHDKCWTERGYWGPSSLTPKPWK